MMVPKIGSLILNSGVSPSRTELVVFVNNQEVWTSSNQELFHPVKYERIDFEKAVLQGTIRIIVQHQTYMSNDNLNEELKNRRAEKEGPSSSPTREDLINHLILLCVRLEGGKNINIMRVSAQRMSYRTLVMVINSFRRQLHLTELTQ